MSTAAYPGSDAVAAPAPGARDTIPGAGGEVADSLWTSLRYFNGYRLIVAALFLATAFVHPDLVDLGSADRRLFGATAAAYLALAIGFQVALVRAPRNFPLQVTLQVLADIVAITLLMYASGGFKSGLAVMLLISLAGAALVSGGLLTLFYAAVASIAVLVEQGVQVLVHDAGVASFVQPALLAIGYFATASITNRLAQRVIMNERVARQRAVELANQLRINALVIQDVQDGVLVIDGNGLVRQANRRVETLAGGTNPELEPLEAYWPELAARLQAWRAGTGASIETVESPDGGRPVRARFVDAGVQGGRVTVAFLEDLSKVEEQARQLKLAALGRLTANIAHEIRNPLSAITHASDLLREENRAPPRERLTRIIRDNAHRLDRMVRDIMELNRRDRAQREPIRLAGFLATFVEEFAQAEKVPADGIVVEMRVEPVLEFDRVHLNQVLWNLVRNGWRHSARSSGSVRILVDRAGPRLELHVVDDGPGVPKDLVPQLFEPFFTTFSSGTGLGLYIARELCAANGAALDYMAGRGGADFRIQWQGQAG
ncbi:MAG: ATP-binding protein [Burkholderiales bacterium]|jgi:two-component system sensor histidine kinase PilS (NtrC family)|nr:ATP-binding protein [Burkholderiales bacterium]